MTRDDSDAALLARYVRDSDQDAFSALARRHGALVFRACHRVLRDRALAEDATQETFVRLMRNGEGVSGSLASWLHRVATRLAIDAARSEQCRKRRELSFAASKQTREELQDEVAHHLDGCIQHVSEPGRTLLVEHYLQGRRQSEMASVRRTSKATISRRIRGSLEEFRRLLEQRCGCIVPAALTTWLAAESAKAAPKARLVSHLGAGQSNAAGTTGWFAMASLPGRMAVVAGALLVFSTLLVADLVLFDAPLSNAAMHDAPAPAVAVSPAVAIPAAGRGEMVFIDSPGSIDSQTVVVFSMPPQGPADRVILSFADGHVRTIPVGEARALIRSQTGKTLEQVLRTALKKTIAPHP